MTAHSVLEVTLVVRDVDASAAHFRALGLSLFSIDEPGHQHHYEGGVGHTVLQLFPAMGRPVSRVQSGFRVINIAEVAARFDELGTHYELPVPMRLRTYDPDGNRIHLSQVIT